jgi:hypothetical protein
MESLDVSGPVNEQKVSAVAEDVKIIMKVAIVTTKKYLCDAIMFKL